MRMQDSTLITYDQVQREAFNPNFPLVGSNTHTLIKAERKQTHLTKEETRLKDILSIMASFWFCRRQLHMQAIANEFYSHETCIA
mmetsp:Transcript_886/g.1500  ORF Transcript_886/g.1500 Transcript_886/m.1500 type:complete len:85 (-) Transcript_886:362-616(-)